MSTATELLPRARPQVGRHACERWLQRVEPLGHLRHDQALQMASASISAIVQEGEEVDGGLLTALPPHWRPPTRYFRDRDRPQIVIPVDPRTWTVTTVLVVRLALQEAI